MDSFCNMDSADRVIVHATEYYGSKCRDSLGAECVEIMEDMEGFFVNDEWSA